MTELYVKNLANQERFEGFSVERFLVIVDLNTVIRCLFT